MKTMNHKVIAWPGDNSLVCRTALIPVSVRVRVEVPVTADGSQSQNTGREALCEGLSRCADAAGRLKAAETATVNTMSVGRMRRTMARRFCLFII